MRCEFSEHEWTAIKPMLPNAACSMAALGSCVQARHGVTAGDR